jgi:hypothetical protein
MSTVVGPNWLDQHVLPDIRQMLVQDAYFKLMSYARQLTGKFNGAIAGLIYAGYVTSQTVAIRRFCDNRRDVISLRRVLEESKKANTVVEAKADYLSQKLDACRSIGELVDNYIAHTGNPQRRPNMPAWPSKRRAQAIADDPWRGKRSKHGRFIDPRRNGYRRQWWRPAIPRRCGS